MEAGGLIGETALIADVVRRVRERQRCCGAKIPIRLLLRVPGATFRRVLSEFPGVAGKVPGSRFGARAHLIKQLDAVRETLISRPRSRSISAVAEANCGAGACLRAVRPRAIPDLTSPIGTG